MTRRAAALAQGRQSTPAALALSALLLASCATAGGAAIAARSQTGLRPSYPAATFAVFSDPHLYDPEAFRAEAEAKGYRAARSLGSADSSLAGPPEELLDKALGMISGIAPDFVLVSGDLTQDGERADHLAFARRLAALSARGIRVFVIPGNHDIDDGDSHFTRGRKMVLSPSIGPGEFADIYADFDYADAVSRAPDSLSYEAQPMPGLALLALDDNRWRENPPGEKAVTGGRISAATRAWLESRLSAAAAAGKAVILAQHHGILEHWRGQKTVQGAYLVDRGDELAALYARWGVRLAFTGHYHAQDAAVRIHGDGSSICDASTGSLVNFPSPIRIVRIEGGRAEFRTILVDAIPSCPDGFPVRARAIAEASVRRRTDRTLRRLGVLPPLSSSIAARAAEDFLGHYSAGGDRSGLWSQEKPLAPFTLDLSLGIVSE